MSNVPVGRMFVTPQIKVSSINSKFCDKVVPTERVLTASKIKLPMKPI